MKVSIKNIKDNGKTISCDVYPEAEDYGVSFLEIDKETGDVVKAEKNEGCYLMHLNMAASLLRKHRKDKAYEDEYTKVCG